jgi:hypothetical protein
MDLTKGSPANILYWMKQRDKIVQLINSQEDAGNKLSAGMKVFVERTSVMKKVRTPYRPRAPWWILHEKSIMVLSE